MFDALDLNGNGACFHALRAPPLAHRADLKLAVVRARAHRTGTPAVRAPGLISKAEFVTFIMHCPRGREYEKNGDGDAMMRLESDAKARPCPTRSARIWILK